jgi:hypothetical protein
MSFMAEAQERAIANAFATACDTIVIHRRYRVHLAPGQRLPASMPNAWGRPHAERPTRSPGHSRHGRAAIKAALMATTRLAGTANVAAHLAVLMLST